MIHDLHLLGRRGRCSGVADAMPERIRHLVYLDSLMVEGGKSPFDSLPPDVVAARIGSVARAAFAAMELRDYGRLDVRLAADGTPYVIDINPNCDLSDASGGFAR